MRYNAGQAAASFPSRWLPHRVAAANPMLHRHLERDAEGLREAAQGSFASHVRHTVTGTIAGTLWNVRTPLASTC